MVLKMAEYTKIETARAIICDMCKCLYPDEDCPGKCDWMKYLKEDAADVAPVVHGRWIEDHDYLKCPECSVMVKWDFIFYDIGNWNYCPNCGAKMDGGDLDGQKV